MPESDNNLLQTILNSKIAKSLTGKAFIINIIPEIAAMAITRDFYTPLVYVYSCVLLVALCFVLENVITSPTSVSWVE